MEARNNIEIHELDNSFVVLIKGNKLSRKDISEVGKIKTILLHPSETTDPFSTLSIEMVFDKKNGVKRKCQKKRLTQREKS